MHFALEVFHTRPERNRRRVHSIPIIVCTAPCRVRMAFFVEDMASIRQLVALDPTGRTKLHVSTNDGRLAIDLGYNWMRTCRNAWTGMYNRDVVFRVMDAHLDTLQLMVDSASSYFAVHTCVMLDWHSFQKLTSPTRLYVNTVHALHICIQTASPFDDIVVAFSHQYPQDVARFEEWSRRYLSAVHIYETRLARYLVCPITANRAQELQSEKGSSTHDLRTTVDTILRSKHRERYTRSR